MIWSLIPKEGIVSKEHSIRFGDSRDELRKALEATYSCETPKNFQNEDDFKNESVYIRVRYDADNRVEDIEFLGGPLEYRDINLHEGTTFSEIEDSFRSIGLSFCDTEWFGEGKDCAELEISIATREQVGGDGDDIEWVIMSNDPESFS